MQLRVVLALLTMAAGCTGGTVPPVPEAGPPTLPEWIQSHDIVHGMAGTDSIIPADVPGATELTLGTVIYNRSDEHVTISSFEVAESSGVTVTPELVIRTPRAVGLVASEAGWPPTSGRWEAEAEHRYGPFDLPVGEDSAHWGAMILMRVVFDDPFGYVKGYRIRGTQGGEPFVDFSDTYTAFCVGTDISDRACTDFANAHAFTQFSLPTATPSASVASTTSTTVS